QRLTRLNMVSSLGSQFKERLAFLDFKEKALAKPRVTAVRQPYFCSGCPHNTSTRVPEGSRAVAGIGCHFMAVWMDRNTATFTHMGAEGAPWIGQAPFTDEKHIRRKRNEYPDPAMRAVINEMVCEGCGDCSVKSNCLSVEPLETEFGRKRAINQSSCNKDFSCLKGFCPSFVTVEGGKLKKG